MHLFHNTFFIKQLTSIANNAIMASRDITEFFKPKLLEALKSAVSDDVISITTVERKEVRNQLKKVEDKKTRRSSYCKYTRTNRAEIGQYVAKSGVANAVQTF